MRFKPLLFSSVAVIVFVITDLLYLFDGCPDVKNLPTYLV